MVENCVGWLRLNKYLKFEMNLYGYGLCLRLNQFGSISGSFPLSVSVAISPSLSLSLVRVAAFPATAMPILVPIPRSLILSLMVSFFVFLFTLMMSSSLIVRSTGGTGIGTVSVITKRGVFLLTQIAARCCLSRLVSFTHLYFDLSAIDLQSIKLGLGLK